MDPDAVKELNVILPPQLDESAQAWRNVLQAAPHIDKAAQSIHHTPPTRSGSLDRLDTHSAAVPPGYMWVLKPTFAPSSWDMHASDRPTHPDLVPTRRWVSYSDAKLSFYESQSLAAQALPPRPLPFSGRTGARAVPLPSARQKERDSSREREKEKEHKDSIAPRASSSSGGGGTAATSGEAATLAQSREWHLHVRWVTRNWISCERDCPLHDWFYHRQPTRARSTALRTASSSSPPEASSGAAAAPSMSYRPMCSNVDPYDWVYVFTDREIFRMTSTEPSFDAERWSSLITNDIRTLYTPAQWAEKCTANVQFGALIRQYNDHHWQRLNMHLFRSIRAHLSYAEQPAAVATAPVTPTSASKFNATAASTTAETSSATPPELSTPRASMAGVVLVLCDGQAGGAQLGWRQGFATLVEDQLVFSADFPSAAPSSADLPHRIPSLKQRTSRSASTTTHSSGGGSATAEKRTLSSSAPATAPSPIAAATSGAGAAAAPAAALAPGAQGQPPYPTSNKAAMDEFDQLWPQNIAAFKSDTWHPTGRQTFTSTPLFLSAAYLLGDVLLWYG